MSVKEYAKETGLSERAVRDLIKNNLVVYTTTNGGGKFLIKVDNNNELELLKQKIEQIISLVEILNKHLGVQELS
jgi:DNA-binding transcriptional MerR regulator